MKLTLHYRVVTLLYDFQPNPLNGATVATVNRSHYVGGVSTHLLSNSPACRWIYHTTNTQSSDGTNSAEYIIGISPNLRSDSFGLTWVGEESKTVSYINGSQVAVKVLDSDGFVSGSDPLGIGCLGSSKTNQHIGCYRDIKFYNTALSKFIMEDSTK